MVLEADTPSRTETIFAVSTAQGRSAVAVVRLSGPACDDALRILAPGPRLHDRRATLRRLRDVRGELLDRALVLRFYAPRSFTGEDMAELHVTGGRGVLRGVLDTLSAIAGLRPAEAGEFAWRAFQNGKLNLSEIEGIGALVLAETAAQRRHALRVADGQLSRTADAIRSMIVRAMSLLETEIDFSDTEEGSGPSKVAVEDIVGAALSSIRDVLQTAVVAERLREGLTVVIGGAPNAGKSTLMNALSKRDVSIVSDVPGTTRDLVEVALDLGGYPVRVIDTAGVRVTSDPIEHMGVERARSAAMNADVTLWLYDDDASPAKTIEAKGTLILVRSKSDLLVGQKEPEAPNIISISAKSGDGLSILVGRLESLARSFFSETSAVSLATERQASAFRAAELALARALASETKEVELRAEDLRLAARAMGRISGRVDVEHVLDDVFSRLCIGK